MKLKPQPKTTAPDYPATNGLGLDRRNFLRLISAAGLAAATAPLLADDSSRKKSITLEQMVKKLASQLGDGDFRKRRAATKTLILIGKGDGNDKKQDAKAKNLVNATMKSLLKHKDPEVSQRAKQIMLALNPPKLVKPPPREPIEFMGDIEM